MEIQIQLEAGENIVQAVYVLEPAVDEKSGGVRLQLNGVDARCRGRIDHSLGEFEITVMV